MHGHVDAGERQSILPAVCFDLSLDDEPAVGVHRVDASAHPHPRAISFAAAAAEDHQAAFHGRAGRGKPALEHQLPDRAIAHGDGVMAAVDGFAFDLHRQRLAPGLGERWRQIDRRAAETRLEGPSGGATAYADAELPVGCARDAFSEDLLRKFDAQLTEIGAALTGDADLSVLARDREACRAAEDVARELR